MAKPKLPMSPDRLRECCDILGVTQAGLGRFIGMDQRTVRRMTSGDREVFPVVAVLLETMIKYDITVRDVLKLMGDSRIKELKIFGDNRPEHFLSGPRRVPT